MSLTFLLCLLNTISLFAQTQIDWKVLQDVRFEYQLDEKTDAYVLSPLFGDAVKQLDGRRVQISGFMIPLDVTGDQYALSALTMNACFFCGGGGPETVIELNFVKKPKRFQTDDYIKLEGTLKLNSTDMLRLSYVLEDAKWIKEK